MVTIEFSIIATRVTPSDLGLQLSHVTCRLPRITQRLTPIYDSSIVFLKAKLGSRYGLSGLNVMWSVQLGLKHAKELVQI